MLDLAKKHTFDLLLIDLYMPDYNGLEVVKKLKKDNKNKNMKIYLMTAAGKEALQGIEENLAGIIHKPFQYPLIEKILCESGE